VKGFFKTVAIVTVFSVCEKFLGFLYRIFLSHSIGTEGIGIYQVALSIFSLLLTLCCSGTPITVSRLMTKYKAEGKINRVHKVVTAGLTFTLALAVPICFACFCFQGALSVFFADDRCVKVFLIVIPGIIFTSIYAVLRGVFWGEKDFLPYSVIELLEEACMILVGVILVSFATNPFDGAMRAGFAVLVSYVFSFALASVVFFVRKNKLKNPKSEFKPLLKSAMPITAMRTASSLVVSVISIILPLRLIAAGFTSTEAMSAYGAAVGQAIPILFIPTTLIGSFTLVLVPEIAENFYRKRHYYLKRDIEKSLYFTVFITCLFIPVFAVLGEEIGVVIFGSYECGKYLSASSFLMLFMSVSSLTTSILNSIGKEHKTLVFYAVGATLMLLSIWFLPEFIGVYSLLVGFTFVYAITAVCNLILISRSCAQKPKYTSFCISSVCFLVPTTVVGLMLEKLLLPLLGTVFTLFIVAIILVVFCGALFVGFNLVSLKDIFSKFGFKKKPSQSSTRVHSA